MRFVWKRGVALPLTPIEAGGRKSLYQGGVTVHVLVSAVVAAAGGMLLGYDTGIVGGVEAMTSWQAQFFPELLGSHAEDAYCKYHDSKLQLFSSVMFLSGAFTALPVGHAARVFGRKAMMVAAGLLFFAGAGLQAGAHNLATLICGRMVLGCGVGTATVVVPIYISEAAPYASRGGLTILFQAGITVGILAAQLVNYGLQWVEGWGWRLSLGLSAIPATVLLLGGVVLPESPCSLIERGRWREGRAVLEMLRGTPNVDAEYADLCDSAHRSMRISHWQSWRCLFDRQNLPITISGNVLAACQQLTGINAIIFYVPILFNSLGTGRNSALLNAVVVGTVNVSSTFVGIFWADRVGRRKLLLEGGVQMMAAMVATAACLGAGFGSSGEGTLPAGVAAASLVFFGIFMAGFAWSWGPLVWVIGAEVQTLEMRASSMSAIVFTNFLFSFLIGQSFLSMLCIMKYGVFLFFCIWVMGMTLFIYFLMPETKGVPIEDSAYLSLFARHPVWRRVMGHAAQEILEREAFRVAAWRTAAGTEGGDIRKLAEYYERLGL